MNWTKAWYVQKMHTPRITDVEVDLLLMSINVNPVSTECQLMINYQLVMANVIEQYSVNSNVIVRK